MNKSMNSIRNTSRIRKIFFWMTTVIIALAYFITGIGNILPFAHIAQDMAHLGYPPYFLKIIGTWKILAAIVIVIPDFQRIKEWAYAGMILDLTGAAFSRFFSGDGVIMIIVPLAISGLVIISWALQPKETAVIS
jgi:hypothetical protein